MKNIFKFKTILRIVGIIALVAVIGFSMVSCDDSNDNKGNGDGNGNGGGAGSGGRLTVNGIPSEYNGKYAFFNIDVSENNETIQIIGCQSVAPGGTMTFVRISNGSVSLPLWINANFDIGGTRYSGNGTSSGTGMFYILNSATGSFWDLASAKTGGTYRQPITFSNGSATISGLTFSSW